MKDGTHLEIALGGLNNYTIDHDTYASECRHWAHMFLAPQVYPPYQLQQFSDPTPIIDEIKTMKPTYKPKN